MTQAEVLHNVQGFVKNPNHPPRHTHITSQFLEWRRTQKLQKTFETFGIDPTQDLTGQLSRLSSAELQQLHYLAIPVKSIDAYQGVGSVGFELGKVKKARKHTDVRNPNYALDLQEGDEYLQLHFAPLGIDKKSDSFSQAKTMFLGCIDGLQLIEWFRQRGQELPKIVSGYTNDTLSRFIINYLGFHPSFAEIKSRRGLHRLSEEELGKLFPTENRGLSLEGKKSLGLEPDTSIGIFSFIKGEEFFSPGGAEKTLTELITLLYRRLVPSDRREPITPENLIALEKEARIAAIEVCMRNQPQYLRW